MMKKREKTMKNGETEKNNEIRLKIWKKTVENDEKQKQNNGK